MSSANFQIQWKTLNVYISRDTYAPWGFTIIGGRDQSNRSFTFNGIAIGEIDQDTPQEIKEKLKSHDIILAVNNIDFTNIKLRKAAKILSEQTEIKLTVHRVDPPIKREIQLMTRGRLGIRIVGGIGSSYVGNDPGIFVEYVPPELRGELRRNDRLLEIKRVGTDRLEGFTRNLRLVTHDMAKNRIADVLQGGGEVILVIGRSQPPENEREQPSNASTQLITNPQISENPQMRDLPRTHFSDTHRNSTFRGSDERDRAQIQPWTGLIDSPKSDNRYFQRRRNTSRDDGPTSNETAV